MKLLEERIRELEAEVESKAQDARNALIQIKLKDFKIKELD